MRISREEKLELLYEMSNSIHSTLDPQDALKVIIQEAVRLTRASTGSVALVNPTTRTLEIHASHGLPKGSTHLQLKVGEGITGWVALSGKPALVADVTEDSRYVLLNPDTRSELAVPLEVQGETRGVINVDSNRPSAFLLEDLELLQELATQASKVVHHTWLYEQVRMKARLYESLASISQTINSTLNLTDALSVITREACTLMRAKTASLLMLDESGEWLDLRASAGAGPQYLSKPRLSVADSLVGIVLRRRKPMQVENVQVSGRYQNVSMARAEGLVSLLSVPLNFDSDAFGVLNVYTGEQHNFSNEEIGILSSLASLSAVALQKARLYERVVDLEEQLRQAEKLSALGLLAAEVAHEIRNPLTVMKMLFHSLDLGFEPNDPRAKDAAIVEGKMNHLNRIVEQILDFARSTEPVLAPVDLNSVIGDLGLLIRHKLKNQSIEFVRDLGKDRPVIMGDSVQLEQAFLNLTLNAVEAMPHGGKLTIRTQLTDQGHIPSIQVKKDVPIQWAIIEFIDTGTGMTEAQRSGAFSSLLHTTKQKGTGLGFAIVKRVVDTHQGLIEINSAPGTGTTIILRFPTRPCRNEEIDPRPSAKNLTL